MSLPPTTFTLTSKHTHALTNTLTTTCTLTLTLTLSLTREHSLANEILIFQVNFTSDHPSPGRRFHTKSGKIDQIFMERERKLIWIWQGIWSCGYIPRLEHLWRWWMYTHSLQIKGSFELEIFRKDFKENPDFSLSLSSLLSLSLPPSLSLLSPLFSLC